jgi:hypothetical protein
MNALVLFHDLLHRRSLDAVYICYSFCGTTDFHCNSTTNINVSISDISLTLRYLIGLTYSQANSLPFRFNSSFELRVKQEYVVNKRDLTWQSAPRDTHDHE